MVHFILSVMLIAKKDSEKIANKSYITKNCKNISGESHPLLLVVGEGVAPDPYQPSALPNNIGKPAPTIHVIPIFLSLTPIWDLFKRGRRQCYTTCCSS